MWIFALLTVTSAFVVEPEIGPYAAGLEHMLIDFKGQGDKSKANRQLCYDAVGCFSNKPPFDNALHFLPDDPKKTKSEFRLYTRDNIDSGKHDLIDYRTASRLQGSSYKRGKPIKFSVHGFAQNADADWMLGMAREFLKKGDMNVILVHWGRAAAAPNYPQAVANVRLIAREMALLTKGLLQFDSSQSLSNVHCLGHSLGAHVCGAYGRDLKGKVARITGMDPAGPFFEHKDPAVRLDPTDGGLVDAIHTNGAPFSHGGAGTLQAMADLDIYVDGGEFQSGCPNPYLGALKDLIRFRPGEIGNVASCSHMRSHDLYVQSINPSCEFDTFPCDSYEDFKKGKCLTCPDGKCVGLGYRLDVNTKARGKMFVNSFSTVPHCAYHHGVELRIPASSGKDIQGELSMQLRGTGAYTELVPITDKKDQLNPNELVQSIVLSHHEVGPISSAAVSLDQSVGWLGGLIGGSDNVLKIDRILIKSAKNGKSISLCEEAKLHHSAFVEFFKPCQR